MNFNPLPRKEGDLEAIGLCLVKREDFNPLPRKEGDLEAIGLCLVKREDFNPLPRKEGDCSNSETRNWSRNFNPLPRKEGDFHIVTRKCLFSAISIHSLVKRETLTQQNNGKTHHHFNPLPRKEGDKTGFSVIHW